jgi:ribosome biogenesis GTPase / thiamine phosphate phosphatase
VQIIATNIDTAFVVESVDRDYNLNRFERYFAIAAEGGVQSAVILNKIDLLSKEELDGKLTELRSRFPSINIISTSTANNEGLKELKNYIATAKTYCFLGSSGVGKSSLINKLLGGSDIKTQKLGAASGRGTHTTTNREMYFLDSGGIVIDNPGIREVGVADAGGGVSGSFDDIIAIARSCKYNDCTHTQEPGCAVLAAVKSGELEKAKYSNYLNLKKEAGYGQMNSFKKREKSRQFGKSVKRAKKDLRDFGHKDFGD